MSSDKSKFIRAARPEDEANIIELLGSTSSSPDTPSNELRIYQILKDKKALAVSLVLLDEDEKLLAYVAYSEVEIRTADGEFWDDWYALGPVLVHKDYRRSGIGTSIIRMGLFQLEEGHRARGVVANGFPSFLRREKLGFKNAADQGLEAPEGTSATYFWAKRFKRDYDRTRGKVQFAWQ